MSSHLLGDTVDIHGGGADLVFPHHESEIAQSEGSTGHEPFVRFWMHTAMVRHEGEKMSKSLGNLVMVNDLLKTWSPDALRLYMGGHHYREPWSHDEEELAQAEAMAEKLREAVTIVGGGGAPLDPLGAWETFTQAMENDLDTPAALVALGQLADNILDAARDGRDLSAAQEMLRDLGSVFGLRLDAEDPEKRVVEGWGRHLERFT